MFYGTGLTGSKGSSTPDAKGGIPATIRSRVERFDQMTKQEQLIEQKKREIEAKLAAERQRKEMEMLMLKQQREQRNALGPGSTESSNSTVSSTTANDSPGAESKQVFANDGSFLDQFKKLQEQQRKAKEKEELKIKEEQDEYGGSVSAARKPAFKILNPNPSPSTASNASKASSTQRTPHSSSRKDYEKDILYGAPPPPPPPIVDSKALSHRPVSNSKLANYQNAPPPPPPPPPPIPQQWQPSPQVKAFAIAVADGGDEIEEMARKTKANDPFMWFLYRPDSKEYQSYRDLVIQIRNEKSFMIKPVPHPQQDYDARSPNMPHGDQDMRLKRVASSPEEDEREKKRRSRWGPQSSSPIQPPVLAAPQVAGISSSNQGMMLPNNNSSTEVPGARIFPGIGVRQGFSQGPAVGVLPIGPMGQAPVPEFGFGPGIGVPFIRGPPPMLSQVTKTNPQLLAYARQSYGTTNLDEEQWKQCEEAYKMNLLFQDIARKKARDDKLSQSGKFKHEYDSDEEVDDDGTWEHKQRMKEMEKTKIWAQELTVQAKGKHHIGDFLPPEELNKFMDKYKAVKEGRQMDESAYQDFKIAQDNVGFKLLQKMGWTDGQGLGSTGQGITAPIDKGAGVSDKLGLGVEKPNDINQDDDEYAAYRKRMMLAYRFRPNPLNNPRRAYY